MLFTVDDTFDAVTATELEDPGGTAIDSDDIQALLHSADWMRLCLQAKDAEIDNLQEVNRRLLARIAGMRNQICNLEATVDEHSGIHNGNCGKNKGVQTDKIKTKTKLCQAEARTSVMQTELGTREQPNNAVSTQTRFCQTDVKSFQALCAIKVRTEDREMLTNLSFKVK
eukprot:CAMPEP_0197632080 /NCGR_PEP_ID=MMETSP1338-20131121/9002_1 /TAXON_ID=43686 ORGANISM="Pelagodinium beii, Strain RCC1491" /NCGR_SAMPLE_ID=MMETSP1338 /ASSEMBLY_ACC=CAM_ASM_000754 /LENGTH=169 /DNA_ID=CAMNT_0043203631 /DNA_START=83 /DNA_END=593 /DNA_ORIENTATION=-